MSNRTELEPDRDLLLLACSSVFVWDVRLLSQLSERVSKAEDLDWGLCLLSCLPCLYLSVSNKNELEHYREVLLLCSSVHVPLAP